MNRTPKEITDSLKEAAFVQVRDNVAAKLRAVRCPEHGTHPTRVEVRGHDLGSLKWEVHGCCPSKLREAAARALK